MEASVVPCLRKGFKHAIVPSIYGSHDRCQLKADRASRKETLQPGHIRVPPLTIEILWSLLGNRLPLLTLSPPEPCERFMQYARLQPAGT